MHLTASGISAAVMGDITTDMWAIEAGVKLPYESSKMHAQSVGEGMRDKRPQTLSSLFGGFAVTIGVVSRSEVGYSFLVRKSEILHVRYAAISKCQGWIPALCLAPLNLTSGFLDVDLVSRCSLLAGKVYAQRGHFLSNRKTG